MEKTFARQVTTYRRANAADGAALSEFAGVAFTDTYAGFNTAENMKAYLTSAYGVDQQTRELTDPAMTTVLAESDGRVIGYAQLRRKEVPACVTHSDPVEIYRFYVDKSAHGTGVAAKLMDESMAAARDLGGQHLWLGVWERNPRAIAFYRKTGFVDVGTQQFKLGSDVQTDRVLIRAL
jgi:ribosomal protein S18 acetylase RimI-like enzyme